MQESASAGRMAGDVREWTGEDTGAVTGTATAVPAEAEVRRLMWELVGVVRDVEPLQRAVAALSGYQRALDHRPPPGRSTEEWRLASIVTVGGLIARAALRRTESRGGHFREDFPARDDVHWSAHIVERSRD